MTDILGRIEPPEQFGPDPDCVLPDDDRKPETLAWSINECSTTVATIVNRSAEDEQNPRIIRDSIGFVRSGGVLDEPEFDEWDTLGIEIEEDRVEILQAFRIIGEQRIEYPQANGIYKILDVDPMHGLTLVDEIFERWIHPALIDADYVLYSPAIVTNRPGYSEPVTYPSRLLGNQIDRNDENGEACANITGKYTINSKGRLAPVFCNILPEGNYNTFGKAMIAKNIGGYPDTVRLRKGFVYFVVPYKTPPWIENHYSSRRYRCGAPT